MVLFDKTSMSATDAFVVFLGPIEKYVHFIKS